MVIDTMKKQQLRNGLLKWHCSFGNCRAVGYLDEQQEFTLKTEHAHLPSPSKYQAKKFANEVQEKAANTGNAPRQIVFNAQIDLPFYAAPTIPSYSTPLRSINRIRQEALETMPKPKNLESVDEIPEPLKLTHSGDTFLYFGDPRPNKTQNKIEKIFGCFELFGKKVVIDFEAAVRNAIRKMQPDTENQFCFCHLGQAVWSNVQKLGFTHKYMVDDEFWLNVKKKMICLAFVPADDVIFAFESIELF